MKMAVKRWPSAAESTAALLTTVVFVSVLGCGNDGPQEGENYGNLLNSPQGLILVQEEHPTGWMRTECFACHEPRNIHTVNRTGLPDCADAPEEACIDLPRVRTIVRDRGEAGCVQCHGNNGVGS